MLGAYTRNECTEAESLQIREYLVNHPEQIIGLIVEIRSEMMSQLKLDSNTDPFRPLIGDAMKLIETDTITANYRLQLAIESFVDEKKQDLNVPKQQNAHNVNENKQNAFNMNTVKFNSSEFRAVNASASRMMENIDSEKSTLGNMVVQLLIQMPEMNPADATAVCRRLVDGVVNFNAALDNLKEENASAEETTENVYAQCIDTLFGKTEKEQASILINFISFIKYVDVVNVSGTILGEDAKTLEQLLSENKSVEGEITPEILDDLKEQLKQAIAKSTIILTQEADLRELISCANGDSTLVEELAKKQLDIVDFKSYAALAAYIACLKGEIEGCDADVQPEVLGASVAAGVERERVMEEAKKGLLSWDKAAKYLKWIGGALLVALFTWVTFELAMLLFSSTALLTVSLLGTSFAAVTVGLLLGGFIGFKGSSWFVDSIAQPIVNGAGEVYDQVIDTLRSGVVIETVKKAYISFVSFFKEIWNAITTPVIIGLNSTVVSK